MFDLAKLPSTLRSFSIKAACGSMVFTTIQPKASRSEWSGLVDDRSQCRLKLRIAAPPVDGEANEEAIRFLSKLFKIPKAHVHLISGERSRQKNFFIEGLSADDAFKLLSAQVA